MPSLKKLILANRGALAIPSSFDLISSISFTTSIRNRSSVTSPSLSLSATILLPLFSSLPTVALRIAITIEAIAGNAQCALKRM